MIEAGRRRLSFMPRDVYVLSLIAFLVMVGFGVMLPVLPVFTRSFGASNFMVGAVVSAFALMRLVTSPVCGAINSKIGAKTALGIGIYIVAASSAAAGLANSYLQLLVMRGLGGVGSAMFSVAAMLLLLRVVPIAKLGRAQAMYSGGFLLGGMTGPAVGGLLATISLTAPFFFYAGMLVLAGTTGLLLLQGDALGRASTDEEQLRGRVALARAWGDARYRAACLTNFASGWQSHGARSLLVPLIVVEVLNRPPAWTGIALAVAAVAQGLSLAPVGQAVDAIGRRPVLITGSITCAVGALAIPWAPNIIVLTVILAVYGVGASMMGTVAPALVGDVAGARSGAPVAAFQMTMDAGSILGPLIAGAIVDAWSMKVAFALGAALMAISAGYAITLPSSPSGSASAPVLLDEPEG